VALDDRFSPAELAIGFAQALVTFGREGNLPAEVARDNDCLGPIEDPLITPEEPCQVGFEVVLGLAEGLLREVKEKRRLPANLPLPGANGPRAVSPGGKLVGLGSVYHLLARAYLGIIEEGRPPEELDVWRFPRQPQLGHSIGQQYADVAESQLVRPNLDIGRLYRYGKLQTWTLAPAWRTEPQMDPDEHGY
jgi:hypothetical protein